MKLRSRPNSKSKTIIRTVIVSVFILAVGLLLPTIFNTAGRVIMYPIHVTNQWFMESSAEIPTYFKGRHILSNQIEELEKELAVAGRTSITQQRLIEENNWLRQLLGATEQTRITAAVVARPGDLPYDLLQIDQGDTDGIIVGAPVYIGSDTVIGFVTHTAPKYAFVQLFTSPGFSATSFVSGPDVVAVLEGYGGGVARVRVPQGIPLQVGNLVHLASIKPGVFGTIDYIENEPSQPEQYGYITLEKPMNSINYVAVATDAITTQSPTEISEYILNELIEVMTISPELLDVTLTTSTATTSDSL